MAGRPPKPSALRVLEGNPGKRDIPEAPTPERARPTRPEFLATEAKREWNRITAELDALGILSRMDRAALATLCELWADVVFYTKEVRARPRVTLTQQGNRQQEPLVGMLNTARKLFLGFAREFGLTPSARVKLAGLGSGEGKQDPFEAFLDRKKQKSGAG